MMIVLIIIIIKANICARTYIPFQASCICKISVDLVQACKTKTVIPEVKNKIAGIIVTKKVFESNASSIPNSNSQCCLIRRAISTSALRLGYYKHEKGNKYQK